MHRYAIAPIYHAVSPSLALNPAWQLLPALRRMAGAHPFALSLLGTSRNRMRNDPRQSYDIEPALYPNEEHDYISHGRQMGEQSVAGMLKADQRLLLPQLQ